MKYLSWLALAISLGFLISCAATAAEQNVTSPVATPAPAQAAGHPSDRPTLTPTFTSTATPVPSATPTLVTPSPIPVKPSATPTSSPTPTSPPPPSTATVVLTAVSATSATAGPAKDGLQLYQEQYCGNCHRLDVAETFGTLGPAHNGLATTAEVRLHAADYTGAATTPAGYIRESIVNPGLYLVPGYNLPRQKMPAFTHLSEAEVEALVQFLLQQ